MDFRRSPPKLYILGMTLFFIGLLLTTNTAAGGLSYTTEYVNYNNTPVNGESDVDSIPNFGDPGSSDYTSAAGGDWFYYKDIVIDNTKVASYLTDFPLLIHTYDKDLKSKAQLDGDDIAFFDAADEQLKHQIETYDPDYNSTHAMLVAWVKTDLSSSDDTTIRMKYGNQDLTSQQSSTAVWDSNYRAVWHLSQDPTGTVEDSTSNNNDGVALGSMTSSDLINSKVGLGIEFDGGDDRIDFGDAASLQISGAITVEAWFRASTDIGNDYLLSKSGGSGDRGWDLSFDLNNTSTNGWTMFRYSDTSQTGYSAGYEEVAIDTWYHVVGVYDPSTAARFYLDGVLVDEDTTSIPAAQAVSTTNLLMGTRGGSGERFEGIIDEARISSTVRSTDWIAATYDNQNDPDSFMTISNENKFAEDVTLDNWEYKKIITVDHNQVTASLSNFPVLLSLYDTDLQTKAQADGDDIAFFDTSGTQLNHEIELYQPNYNTTHARLVAWVQTDLSGGTDTSIVMKYGNATMVSQENAASVWNTYNHIWHLTEDPSGTAPQVLDSKLLLNGTSDGSMTSDDLINGQIYNGLDFDGTDDLINLGTIQSDSWTELTMSVWVNKTASGDDRIFSVASGTGVSTSIFAILVDNTVGEVTARLSTDGVGGNDATSLTTNTNPFALNDWYHIVITWSAATETLTIFVNGQNERSFSKDGDSIKDTTVAAAIGNANTNPSDDRFLTGKVDEVRVGSIAQSDDWIATEYNNQNDPDSFYSVSKELNTRYYFARDITVDSSKVPADVSNYPLLVSIYDTNLKDHALGNGLDIKFYDNKDRELSYQLEEYDYDYNSTHAKLVAWVKTPLKSASDTTITMKYGTSLESTVDPTSTWDNNFGAVWHLNEDPSGTVPQMLDATSNNNDGTTAGSPLTATGIASSALEFTDGSGQYVQASDSASLTLADTLTISAWVKPSAVGQWQTIASKLTAAETYPDLYFALDTTNALVIEMADISGSDMFWDSNYVLNTGNWHHVAFSYDSSTSIGRMYVNGSSIGSNDFDTGSLRTNTDYFYIGYNEKWDTEVFDGTIDELRVSNIVRSADWHLTEYNNIIDPDTFYTISDEYVVGPENIAEENRGAITDYDEYADSQASNVDGPEDRGIINNFSNLQAVDDTYATISESATDHYAANMAGSYFSVGGTGASSTSFSSTYGTIEMWLYFDTVQYRPWGQHTDFEIRIVGGALQFDIGGTNTLDSPTSLQAGKWYFVAATWDETADDLSLYIGDESASPTLDAQNSTWAGTTFTGVTGNNIFASWDTSNPVDGKISEFRYWNTTRSLTEIKSDYNTALSGSETGLRHYYKFENSLTDQAGSADLVESGSLWGYTQNVPSTLVNGLELNQEIQFTSLVPLETHTLAIKTGTLASEAVDLSYWNGASWTQLASDLVDNSWNNFSIQVDSSTFTLRFFTSYLSTDNTTDSWQIDAIFIDAEGSGFVADFVDNDSSNVDGSADIGTQGNFANMQDLDDQNDVFIERLWSGNDNSARTLGSGDLQIGGGTADWRVAAGTISFWVRFDDISGEMWGLNDLMELQFETGNVIAADWGNNDAVATTTVPVVGVWYFLAITWDENADELKLYVGTESSAPVLEDQDLSWTANITTLTLGTNSFLAAEGSTDIKGDGDDLRFFNTARSLADLQSDYNRTIPTNTPFLRSYFTFDEDVVTDYGPDGNDMTINGNVFNTNSVPSFVEESGEFSLEVQWTNLPVDSTALPTLAIYAGNMDTEDLGVQYWDGTSWVSLFTDLIANSWNNITIYDELTSSTFTIRYKDAITVADKDQNQWLIDVAVITFENYYLEWEHQISNFDTNKDEFFLTVYTQSNDVNEEYDIEIWDVGSSAWIGGFATINSTLQWHNITLTGSSLITSTMTWRYVSTNQTLDTFQSDLFIYYAGIASYDWFPVIVEVPSDLQYNEGDTGNKLTWKATDHNPGYYQVLRDGVQITNTTWQSNTDIDVGVDGLTKGTYNYTILINDVYGYQINDTAFVTVVDQTKPVYTNTPTDLQYSEGSTGNTLSWTATDTYNNTYELLKDGVQETTGSWSSGVELTFNVDGLLMGSYNYTLVVYDESGNFANDTAFVTVIDTTDPVFDSIPGNDTYSEGSTGNTLTWNSTDNYPNNYEIYRDGVLNETGTWDSATEIVYNMDGLLKGSHNITIVVYDDSGNFISDSSYITVVDTTDPSISSPPDIEYEEGDTGNKIDWVVNENYPKNFTIYKDGVIQFSNSYSETSGTITWYVDGLGIGTYNYTLLFYDQSGNWANDTVYVTVVDTLSPSVTAPADSSFSESSQGNDVSWTVTDNNPDTYAIYEDGISVDSGTWVDGGTITYDLDYLTKGFYNFTIIVWDDSGNWSNDTVYITVTDDTAPVVDSPADITYNEGSTNNNITWTATDTYTDTYQILNGTGDVLESGGWSSGVPIVYDIDGLTKGSYNFTIVLSDASGNTAVDTVIVTVVDNTDPVIVTTTSDINYNEETTGNDITWNATDAYPSSYKIYKNGSQVATGTWISGTAIVYNVDGLLEGVYNYTIVFRDQSGNTAQDTVIVTATDGNAPSLSSPDDIEYEETDTGNSITWNADDTHPNTIVIYRNGSEVYSGSWSSGDITHNVDGLTIGVYNYTILLTDDNGQSSSDLVWVTVVDTVPPSIDSPPDILSPLGSTVTLEWTGTDRNADYYVLYYEGAQNQTGSWISGAPITFEIDGLGVGEYNYTLEIFDTSGNRVWDEIIVTVTSESVFVSTPGDTYYVVGTTGNELEWVVSDADPEYYFIYNNSVVIDEGTWQDNVPITINIDGLAIGTYNFTIWVNDTANNAVTDQLTVFVSDMPIWDPAQVLHDNVTDYIEGSTGNNLQWNTTDKNPGIYEVYLDGVLYNTSSWDNATLIDINIDGLTLGTYNFTIYILDTYNNTISDWLLVTVIDTTPPSVDDASDITFDEGSTGNNIDWTNAIDAHAYNYTIYQNDSAVETGMWSNDTTISYNVDHLLKGVYNFTLLLQDTSGNQFAVSLNVTVLDGTDPVITVSPGDQTYSEGTGSTVISWTAIDNYNSTYEILNSTGDILASGTWDNDTAITYDIGNRLKGYYNFTLVVYDLSGNFAFNTIFLNVTDDTAPNLVEPIPTDYSFAEGDPNTLSWNFTDNYADTYELYINDILNNTGSWTSGNLISFTLDNYLKGTYNFTIVVQDASGNLASHTVWVTVTDETPPAISSPSDISDYEEGTTGHSITWTVTENYPMNYTIYLDGVDVQNSTNYDGSDITINIDGLERGFYNFTVVVYDLSNNWSNDTVYVTVLDLADPVLQERIPSGNFTYGEGDTGNVVSWNITDIHADYYEIYRNGTVEVQSATGWTSGQFITFNIDGYAKGFYNFTIYAYDDSGNVLVNTIYLQVIDDTLPIIWTQPSNTTYVEGDTGNTLTWNATDAYTNNYVIYNNSEVFNTTAWTSGDNITINIDGLARGLYNFTIVFEDDSGNQAIHTVWVTVNDETDPGVTNPADITDYIEGTTGHSINWTGTDLHPDNYIILKNNVQVFSDTWTSGVEISYNIDGLVKGTHNFTIVLFDDSGNSVVDTVIVTVLDTSSPVFDSRNPSGNYTYSEQTGSHFINWNYTDAHPLYYEIYQNGTSQELDDDSWTSGDYISFDVGGRSLGLYNFTIVVYDDSGNFAINTIWVTVTDDTPPTISKPDDITFIEDSTGNEVSWINTNNELHPDNYTIYVNGSIEDFGTWLADEFIVFNMDHFVKGLHNVTIIIGDTSGNIGKDTVWVTVVDQTLPTLSNPPDIEYLEGGINNVINWTTRDNSPDNYTIYLDGVVNETGFWTDGGFIAINVDGLLLGTYNYTIIIEDESGNQASDTVIVNVIELTKPTIHAAPDDYQEYEEGTSFSLQWNASDSYNYTYYVEIDGILFNSGNWDNYVNITVDIGGSELSTGIYNFTIFIQDTSLNTVTDWAIVTVVDTVKPTISGPSDFTYESGSTGNLANWTAFDNNPFEYNYYIDGIDQDDFDIWNNGVIISINVDNLPLGVHNVTIIVYDESGNYEVDTVLITVEDTIVPAFVNTSGNITFAEDSTNNVMQWTFTDVNPDTYTVYIDGNPQPSQLWSSGTQFSINLDTLKKGTHNITLVVKDKSGNSYAMTNYAFVVDQTDPVIDQAQADISYDEGTTGHSLSWKVSDTYASNYTLLRNGSEYATGTWNSVNNITVSIDGLAWDVYNFTIIIADESGNLVVDTVIVSVYDVTLPEFITEQPDITMVEGSTGNVLSWNVTDIHAGNYSIIQGSSYIVNGTWVDLQNITLNIDYLAWRGDTATDRYNFTLVVYDLSFNMVNTTVWVTVIDITPPELVKAPPETHQILLGETDRTLNYTVTDLHAGAYTLYRDGLSIRNGIWQNGTELKLLIGDLPADFYNFTIVFTDETGNSISFTTIVRVKDPLITDTNRPEITLEEDVYEGDVEVVEGNWTDINGNPVVGGTITALLYLQNVERSFTVTTDSEGNYRLVFNYTGLLPGQYYWEVSFEADGYQPWNNYDLPVKIRPHTYSIQIQAPPELVQGESYDIAAIVTYANNNSTTLNSTMLGLDGTLTSRDGEVAAGVLVQFTITLETEDGEVTYVRTARTDNFGVAIVTLSPGETSNVLSIVSISAQIAESDANNPSSSEFDRTKLPVILPGEPTIFEKLLILITQYLAVIIVALIIIVFLVGLLVTRQRKQVAYVRQINNSIKVAYDELTSIQAIRSIIIQTQSKLTIYEDAVFDTSLNTNLIGGMVTAFSSFLNEIGKNEAMGFEVMERDDVSITVHKGKISNFIVISQQKLPLIVLQQIQTAQKAIEAKYKDNFTNTSRGVRKLTSDQVFPLFHEARFKVVMARDMVLNSRNINRLMRQRNVSRALKQNIQLLNELPSSPFSKRDGKFNMNDIVEFFLSKDVNERVSARVMALAYQFNIIQPDFVEQEE